MGCDASQKTACQTYDAARTYTYAVPAQAAYLSEPQALDFNGWSYDEHYNDIIIKAGAIYSTGDGFVNANNAYGPFTWTNVWNQNDLKGNGGFTGVNNAEVQSTQKDGKYIKDGKIVIVKGGQEFNATGAQMK